MSFQIPTTGAALLALGNKMYQGLVELGVALKMTQMTPAEFQVFVTEFKAADDDFNAGRSAQATASGAYQDALAANDAWLATVKGVLLGAFGTGYTTQWAQAGFINNTTAIPMKVADRVALTGRLTAFFTKSPGYEVPTMNVTAAGGTARSEAIATAQGALTAATRNLKTLGQTWDAAFAALSNAEWTVVKLLQISLDDDDPRWLAFGLQMPGTSSTPGQPTGLSAQVNASGAIVAQNDPTPLATRYRYRMLIVGVETDYRLVASSPAPLAQITGVQPGQTVQLVVQAVNGGLQGVASDPVAFTVPLPFPPAAAKSPEPGLTTLLPEPLPARNGASANGHHARNGHAAPAPAVFSRVDEG